MKTVRSLNHIKPLLAAVHPPVDAGQPRFDGRKSFAEILDLARRQPAPTGPALSA